MNVYTVDITSWTASFRYPNLISGFQPTLEVPPLSTVLGLINAAAGQYLYHRKLNIGYYFAYEMKGEDLETIYQIDSNKGQPTSRAKSNIMRREFLFNAFLRLYLEDKKLADFFRKPCYSLVLGRMNDLATVTHISEKAIELSYQSYAQRISGQIVPFTGNHLAGQIQALPKYFTNAIPRNNLGTEPYSIISFKSNVHAELLTFHDKSIGKHGIDIYRHELDFTQYE